MNQVNTGRNCLRGEKRKTIMKRRTTAVLFEQQKEEKEINGGNAADRLIGATDGIHIQEKGDRRKLGGRGGGGVGQAKRGKGHG